MTDPLTIFLGLAGLLLGAALTVWGLGWMAWGSSSRRAESVGGPILTVPRTLPNRLDDR